MNDTPQQAQPAVSPEPLQAAARPVADGGILVRREKLQHAYRQAKLAVDCIVGFAKDNPGGMCGWLDDACTGAEIAARDLEDLLTATPPTGESTTPATMTDERINSIADELFNYQQLGGKVPSMDRDAFREIIGAALSVAAASEEGGAPDIDPLQVYADRQASEAVCKARTRLVASLATPTAAAPTAAARDVLAERQRQVSVEGWTPEHDDEHTDAEMAQAASCYADPARSYRMGNGVWVPSYWPWASSWWKPASERRNLVKAGALILAEIERLDRASTTTPQAHQPQAGDGGGK